MPTTARQQIQPCQQPPPAQINSKGSKTPVSSVPSRVPEFSLPDPLAPPPAHFLRNQQNLLGNAGLVAGVKPSTITHIRGTTSSNPIVVDDDEDTPLLGRRSQSGEPYLRYVNPGVLTAPTNEDILSVLIGQKDIFPVLKGILGLIGGQPAQRTPTTSLQSRRDSQNDPPSKKRKLNRVPAGATDWDVPYPFQEGEGPDEYRKTWERERTKHLVGQLVKLVKMAARKAATKNYLQKEQTRQAAWEKLRQEMMGSEPIVLDSLPQDMDSTPFPTSSSSSRQPSLIGDDAIDPSLLAVSVQSTSERVNENFSMSQAVSPVPSMGSSNGGPMTPISSAWEPDVFMGVGGDGGQEGGGWDEVGQITRDSLADDGNVTPMVGKGKAVLGTSFSSADATTPYNTLMGTQSTDIVPSPYGQATIPEAQPPRPKNTISQSRKEEILRLAREKKKQVQEELDRVKTQLWETTIEQAALVHLLKRFDNVPDVVE